MPITEWHKLWGREIWHEGRPVALVDFQQQQAYKSLSDDAKLILIWRRKRKRQGAVSMIELSKCLMPPRLRKAEMIRKLMTELFSAGFATPCANPVRYGEFWRREAWMILQAK